MLRFCGLLNFLIYLSSVPAHPMMGGDVDMTMSTVMSTAPSVHENDTPADEHTSRPTAEESDITMTNAPMTAAPQLGSLTYMNTFAPTEPSTTLSNIFPSIIGMTNLFDATTSMMNNKIEEHATTTHLAPASELSVMIPTTHSTQASDQSDMVPSSNLTPAPELSTMLPTTHLTSVSEPSTMVPLNEANSIVPSDTSSETLTTKTPMTLPATTTMMTMTTSNHDTTEILKPADDTVSVDITTTTLSPIFSLFGFTSPNDLAGYNELAEPNKIDEPVDNVLTMSSNDDTTRMATSTDSKIDGGDKQTVSSTVVTEPPRAQETSNELDSKNGGKNGCNSISTSLALLSLATLYVIF